MRVGIFMWEPGLSDNKKSASGGAGWTRALIDYLLGKGDRVEWLAGKPPVGCERATGWSGCDVILFYYRWAMPEYPERATLYHDQWSIIFKCIDRQLPVVIFDGDHKITPAEMALFKANGIPVYAPELFPRDGVKQLIFPNPFKPGDVPERPRVNEYTLSYVGNNYERYNQAKHYLSTASKLFSVALYGNWLDRGKDGRQAPDQVTKDFPNVTFPGRVDNDQVIPTLQKAGYTIHLFKESYGPAGFVTMRWLEAVVAGIPAFIPAEMRLPEDFQAAMKHYHLVVRNSIDLSLSVRQNYLNSDRDMLKAQRDFIIPLYRVEPWREALVAATDRSTC